ncbi:MAG: ribonuclease J [Myxococcales bacterium]|nr:MAG: ribonuclease J [Myxococcales bacterium]
MNPAPAETLPERFKPRLLREPSLQITPLGGLGEIGMNMMVYRWDNDAIVVDCGGLLPDPSLLGIDLVLPDYAYLHPHRDKIRALILTHGHEDHIGGTPYFLRDFKIPVYGTRFTIELVKSKIEEHPHLADIDYHVIEPDDAIVIGPFHVTFLHVNHSISQTVSLAIDTPEGLVVHTGDFRIDSTPTDGRVFDYEGFAQVGRRGVLALLSDSTNVDRPGYSQSEKDVARELDALIHRARGRVLVSLFASSIPRIQEVVNVAKRYGRKVHVAGNRLVAATQIARGLGLLRIDPSMLIDVDQVEMLPPEKVMVIMTGSQGEPRSVLSRVALDDHKQIRVREGDVVIFSARVIPGHERTINNLINHLSLRGAEVYFERTHKVHTSGHGHAGELATMLNLVRPHYFIPIHGEYYHLIKHGRLAVDCGVPPERVLIAHNGDTVQFADGQGALVGRTPVGRVYVDGRGVGDVSPEEIRERRKIAETGLVLVLLVIRQATGEILYGPELMSRGFVFEQVSKELMEDAKKAVLTSLESFSIEMIANLEEVKEEVRTTLRRFFNRALNRKPVVIPVVMEM